jgi:hypothetical protein
MSMTFSKYLFQRWSLLSSPGRSPLTMLVRFTCVQYTLQCDPENNLGGGGQLGLERFMTNMHYCILVVPEVVVSPKWLLMFTGIRGMSQ